VPCLVHFAIDARANHFIEAVEFADIFHLVKAFEVALEEEQTTRRWRRFNFDVEADPVGVDGRGLPEKLVSGGRRAAV